MRHAREDYNVIQDCTAARELARQLLNFNPASATEAERAQLEGLHHLARVVLGQAAGSAARIPEDEPVFLIRAQDAVGAEAVRHWATLAEAAGAAPPILALARGHAVLMDAWPVKKRPDFARAA